MEKRLLPKDTAAKVYLSFLFKLHDKFFVKFCSPYPIVDTGVPVEDNTTSECIRTVAATYDCKILQLYECEADEYGYEAKCEWYPKNTTSSCNLKDRRLSTRSLSTCFKIKLITITFYEDKTISGTPYTYSVAGYIWISLKYMVGRRSLRVCGRWQVAGFVLCCIRR